jgi:hypothetical protein
VLSSPAGSVPIEDRLIGGDGVADSVQLLFRRLAEPVYFSPPRTASGDRLRGWGGRIRNFAFRMIVNKPERFRRKAALKPAP